MGSVYTYTCKDLSDLVAFSFLASEPFMLPAGDACSWGGKRRFPIILLSPQTPSALPQFVFVFGRCYQSSRSYFHRGR